MECREFLARFSDYLDGELHETKRRAIESHLEHCEKCSTYRVILSDGLMAYHELPAVDLSHDFNLGFQHRLFHVREGASPGRGGRVLFRGIVPTLSASALFIFAAYFLAPRFRLTTPPPPEEAAVMRESHSDISEIGKAVANPSTPVDEATDRPGRIRESPGIVESAGAPRSITSETETSRGAPSMTGKREWNDKFVRNNLWRVFAEPSAGFFIGGDQVVKNGPISSGEGDDVLSLAVSSAPGGESGRLSSMGSSRYMMLGVSIAPVEFQVGGEEFRQVKKGLRVLRVHQMTPAHLAGILPGDTIISLDHVPVEDPEGLAQLVHSFANQTKSVQIYRLGRLIDLYVDL